MNPIKREFYIKKAKKVVKILNQRKYDAIYVDTLEEAKKIILETIPKGAKVAMGGSETLKAMNMIEEMRQGEYDFIDRFNAKDFEQEVELYRQGLLSDYFLTSTNAITEDGRLLNIDSSGNRAAGIIFGPKHVIVAAGFNKIVKNIDEGLKRLEEVAPMNCKRLVQHNNAPCVATGECSDCLMEERMCNYISIVNQGGKFPGRFKIIIIGQDIGF
ncbi:MAG: lactate utilization protein [Cellulosilyticaceae bacterium]